ncbi:MAG TPA: hypothetical protein VK369_11080 [Segetibacter sp.]|nr:hypothetical protein [Segetibacter sp.]
MLCRNSDKVGGLFNKCSTVHTATQSCPKQEMHQEASEEAIVVMKFLSWEWSEGLGYLPVL